MKIDCHVHLVGASETSGCYLSKRMRRSAAYKYLLWSLGLSRVNDPKEQERLYIDRLASYVKSSQIDRAVLLAFDKVYTAAGKLSLEQTHHYVPNDYVAGVCRERPDVFLLGASVHPYRVDALEELERVFENGAVLIKLLPNSQGFDPSDSALRPYFRKMRELGLPLLIHLGYEHTIPTINQSFGFSEKLRPALEEGITAIIAHAGSSGLMHRHETIIETLKLLCDFPNCFADTSALTNFWRSKYLIDLLEPERLLRKYGIEIENPLSRMIHGSDYPIPITPFVFRNRLLREHQKIIREISNPIEKDIQLKNFLGVPGDCFTRAHYEIGLGKKLAAQ